MPRATLGSLLISPEPVTKGGHRLRSFLWEGRSSKKLHACSSIVISARVIA